MSTEPELIADKFRTLTDQQLDAEEARIERGRQSAQRRQDLARYNVRLTALTAERMRRAAPSDPCPSVSIVLLTDGGPTTPGFK